MKIEEVEIKMTLTDCHGRETQDFPLLSLPDCEDSHAEEVAKKLETNLMNVLKAYNLGVTVKTSFRVAMKQ